MTTTIHLAFHDLPDPRAQNRSYALLDILFITICAMIARAEDFDEVVDWAKLHRDFLREFLPHLGPIPTPQTLRRVFSLLDPVVLEAGFVRWAAMTSPAPKGKRRIGGDGKSLRGSFADPSRADMFHSVSLMCHDSGMMLATTGSSGKGHEVEDLRSLLRVVVGSDTLFTLDALHTTTETARLIVEGEGDYLMVLKDNCSTCRAQAELLFESAMRDGEALGPRHEETDSGHGRVETRRVGARGHEVVRERRRPVGRGQERDATGARASRRRRRIDRGSELSDVEPERLGGRANVPGSAWALGDRESRTLGTRRDPQRGRLTGAPGACGAQLGRGTPHGAQRIAPGHLPELFDQAQEVSSGSRQRYLEETPSPLHSPRASSPLIASYDFALGGAFPQWVQVT